MGLSIACAATLAVSGAVPPDAFHDPDLTPPPLETAIARTDGDYACRAPYEEPGDERVPLPAAVRERIRTHGLREFLATIYEGPTTYASRFGPVFRIRVARRDDLVLYVSTRHTVMHFFSFDFFIHDIREDAVTREPFTIDGWDQDLHLVRRPRVAFEDIDLDGAPEIVVEEGNHFGTGANEVFAHYLRIAPDLSLIPLLRVRPREYDNLGSRRGHPRHRVRTVEPIGPGRVLVRLTLSSDLFRAGDEEVGYAILESPGPQSPFRAIETVIFSGGVRGSIWKDMDE
ncbi:MAG: hypothetical protein JXP34_01380 [Planctomycetes bacterium]|nr:hypothetical protein [Planctomycetota bacterium]